MSKKSAVNDGGMGTAASVAKAAEPQTMAERENAIMRACLEEIAEQDPWRLTGWSHLRAQKALADVDTLRQGGAGR